jgi:hypothetical protein
MRTGSTNHQHLHLHTRFSGSMAEAVHPASEESHGSEE